MWLDFMELYKFEVLQLSAAPPAVPVQGRFTSSAAGDDRYGVGLARGVSHEAGQRAVQSSAGTSQRLPCVLLRALRELTRP